MSGRRAALGLALAGAAAAAACGGAPPPAPRGPSIRLSSPTADPEFGKAFPLSVEREWDAGDAPGPWADAALAPLVVRAAGVHREEARGRVLETRRFVAHAFRSGPLRIPGPRFEAAPAGGGPARSAVADSLDLRVRPSVDPARPGDPELPTALPPLPVPRGTRIALLLGALLAAAAGFLAVRRRPRPGADPAGPDGGRDAAAARALERIRAARSRAGAGGGGAGAAIEEAAAAVREYLQAGRGLATAARTSEEILRAPLLSPAARDPLATLLGAADLVKFAGAEPSAGEAARSLDAAEVVVTAEGDRA